MPRRFVTFLWQFARRPRTTGAIAPSSRGLARRMVEDMGVESADVIFEFGAGTGVFTRTLIERMKPDAQLVAVEINPAMVRHLRRRFPALSIMEESAENVDEYRERHGIGPIDCVICGLPWAVFSDELQDSLLDSVVSNLRPGGAFATFAYLHSLWFPAARRLERKLGQRFGAVDRTRPVWRNLPPALVYRCRKTNGLPPADA